MIPSGVWRHYKGGLYQVIGVGQHTETNEIVVVYIALTGSHMSGPRIRVRPLLGTEGFAMPEAVNGGPRFEYVGTEIPPLMQTEDHNA